MTQWADYSAGRPSGAALRAAGFDGAIRYVGLGNSGKRLAAGEYAALTSAGVNVLLVAESGTSDAWGTSTDDDRSRGRANATAALNDARALGVPDSVGIAAAADAHALNQVQINDAVAYTRGFEDVLGHARTGFYGFSETLNAVHNAGVASWYWRCGSEPSTADKNWIHFWQRNAAPTTRVVSGVPCDINEQYNPVSGNTSTTGFLMALSDAQQQFILDKIHDIDATLGEVYKATGGAQTFGQSYVDLKTKVDWMYSVLGNTPDTTGDGKQGDLSLVDFRQLLVDKLTEIDNILKARP